MKSEFKKRLEALKNKNTVKTAKPKNSKKSKNNIKDIESAVPKEDRSYLPKRTERMAPVAPVKNRRQYICEDCKQTFEDYIGLYGTFNNPICDRCKSKRGY